MNYYEILYIVNPNFERKKIDDAMKEIEDKLKKTKSTGKNKSEKHGKNLSGS